MLVFSVRVSVVRLSDSVTVPLTGLLFARRRSFGREKAVGFDIRAGISSAASFFPVMALSKYPLLWCYHRIFIREERSDRRVDSRYAKRYAS